MVNQEKLGWLDGIYLQTKESKLIFDPVKKISDKDAYIFISHAHSDHTKGFNSPNIKYATTETKLIFETLTQKKICRFNSLEIEQKVNLDNITVKALNSGHILGSTQFLIETPERTILYTGDINCINTLTTDAAERVDCDTLIIEGTYGKPFYKFPQRETIYNKIVKWAIENITIGKTPILYVYAAGKAQELVKLFNYYTTVPVITDKKISSVNKIFNKFKDKLIFFEFNNNEKINSSIHVITNHSYLPSQYKTATANVTGWVLNYRNHYNNFPLSGHADFNQLLDFIKTSSAKEIFIFTGFTNYLASYIRKNAKINAQPLPIITQRQLLDFI